MANQLGVPKSEDKIIFFGRINLYWADWLYFPSYCSDSLQTRILTSKGGKILSLTYRRTTVIYVQVYFQWQKICLETICRSYDINSFTTRVPFLYPLKTSENLMVFRCFQGVEKVCIGSNWVKTVSKFRQSLTRSTRFSTAFGSPIDLNSENGNSGWTVGKNLV